MQSRLSQYIQDKHLIAQNDRLLVAVSGGVDSMVLADLLLKNGYQIALAHCNYQLRGQDSEEDQALVEQFAQANGIPFHVKRINTEKLVKQTNSSVQMVAREERYRFFEDLVAEHSYDKTVLAHNANDRVESLLINVLRGTGFRGLQGMPVKRDLNVRPLLFATKDEIRKYAQLNDVSFREDNSNNETYYQRNWVRLRLMPMLKRIDPEIEKKLLVLCERTEADLPKTEAYLTSILKDLTGNDRAEVEIDKLQKTGLPFTVIRELLNPLGFSSEQVFEVLDLVDSESGSIVENRDTRVLKDRNSLIIEPIYSVQTRPNLQFEILDRTELESLKVPSSEILLDSDLLNSEEWLLRTWQKGDKFKPFGMAGWKKLSDFFIDQKLSVSEKEKVWILTHNNNIVWVVGMRMDDRFKIAENTQKVLKISLAE